MSNRAKLVNPFCYNPRITAQYIVCTSDFMPFDEKSISQFESNFMTWHNNYIHTSLACFVLLQCNSSFQAFSCFTVKHFRVSSFLLWRIFDLIRLEILNEILLSCFINLAIFLEEKWIPKALWNQITITISTTTYWHTNLWKIWYI